MIWCLEFIRVLFRSRIHGHPDGGGAVRRRDAGGDVETSGGVDRHGEGGLVRLGVVLGHLGQAQGLTALWQEMLADQPTRENGRAMYRQRSTSQVIV